MLPPYADEIDSFGIRRIAPELHVTVILLQIVLYFVFYAIVLVQSSGIIHYSGQYNNIILLRLKKFQIFLQMKKKSMIIF